MTKVNLGNGGGWVTVSDRVRNILGDVLTTQLTTPSPKGLVSETGRQVMSGVPPLDAWLKANYLDASTERPGTIRMVEIVELWHEAQRVQRESLGGMLEEILADLRGVDSPRARMLLYRISRMLRSDLHKVAEKGPGSPEVSPGG